MRLMAMDDWMTILWRRFTVENCIVGGEKYNREYLYDAYSERDHIPLAK